MRLCCCLCGWTVVSEVDVGLVMKGCCYDQMIEIPLYLVSRLFTIYHYER